HKWIRNSSEVIKSGDAYANKIFAEHNNLVMTPFPHLSEADIDDILAYTAQVKETPKPDEGSAVTGGANVNSGSSNELVLGVLIVVLLVLVTMLYMVNKGLKNIAQAKGVELMEEKRPTLWQAF